MLYTLQGSTVKKTVRHLLKNSLKITALDILQTVNENENHTWKIEKPRPLPVWKANQNWRWSIYTLEKTTSAPSVYSDFTRVRGVFWPSMERVKLFWVVGIISQTFGPDRTPLSVWLDSMRVRGVSCTQEIKIRCWRGRRDEQNQCVVLIDSELNKYSHNSIWVSPQLNVARENNRG